MARILLINDFPEVVVLISHIITPGHELLLHHMPADLDEIADENPDAIVVVLFRAPDAVARPIRDFRRDVMGGELLAQLNACPALAEKPIVVFGIGVLPSELQEGPHYHSYLTFPQAVQELNPLLSALVGPAPQPEEGRKAG